MKILTSRSASGTSIGGGEMSMRDHAIVLRSLGHEVSLVSNLDYLKQEAKKHQLPFTKSLWAYRDFGVLRIPYYLIVWPLMWIHYLYIALKEKPDIIYPHSRDDQVIFTLLKPLHRKPVVWRDPSDLRYFLQNDNPNVLARLNRWFLIQAIKRADKIFTLTREEQGVIIEHSDGVADKSKVAHFGSNVMFSNYNLDEQPVEKSERLVIGTMIRLVEDKGVQDLIKAFVRLAEKHANIELWIVGDGDYRAELERLALNHKRIRFWGQQANQSEFYTAFDIFVQPAHYEGWGRTIKEAMHFGLPIAGSHTGGIALQLEHERTGLLFAPKSPIELAKQLERLIENPKIRAALGKSAAMKSNKDGDFTTMLEAELIPTLEQLSKGAN